MTPQSTLKVGKGLVLPLDSVTETFGFIGNRGSGKTYGAKVVAEEMLKVRAQVVVLDPVDAWYGLRYGARRGSSGLPVYVFGGAHGDASLEATAGALLADVVVEQEISAVFSMRHLPKQQQRRFVRDFATQLYLRKGEDKYRSAIHVFIEEAHTFAPQTQFKGEAVDCLGAIQDLVLQGRGSGIGVSLVTQRVATVSKAVLELVEVMFAFRTTGPNARKALSQWFAAQDGDDHLKEFLSAIPALPRGECWAWSPGYLELFKHVAIRAAETFDSSATPKGGARRVRPTGAAAKLDIKALDVRIAETIEHAEANDPKNLHARIRELERELSKKQPTGTKVEEVHKIERVVETVRVEVMPEGFIDYAEQLGVALQLVLDGGRQAASIGKDLTKLAQRRPKTHKPETVMEVTAPKVPAGAIARRTSSVPVTGTPENSARVRVPTDSDLSKQAQAFLATIAKRDPVALTETQLSTMSGYRRSSSSFKPSIKELVVAGYVVREGKLLHLTDGGRDAAGVIDSVVQSPVELLNMWASRFPKQAADFLRIIAAEGPLTKDELDELTPQYSRTSSSFDGSLRMLRQNGVITINGDKIAVVEELVE